MSKVYILTGAAGIGGIVTAPYAILPTAIAAVGLHTKIVLEKKDGSVVDLKGRAVTDANGK